MKDLAIFNGSCVRCEQRGRRRESALGHRAIAQRARAMAVLAHVRKEEFTARHVLWIREREGSAESGTGEIDVGIDFRQVLIAITCLHPHHGRDRASERQNPADGEQDTEYQHPIEERSRLLRAKRCRWQVDERPNKYQQHCSEQYAGRDYLGILTHRYY